MVRKNQGATETTTVSGTSLVRNLEGGRIPRSKYPRATRTLDQFVLEEEILHLTQEKINHTAK